MFRRLAVFFASIAIIGVFSACQGPSENPVTYVSGTLTVEINTPSLAGLNAGCNAVDLDGENLAVSNLLVLDENGQVQKTLEMDGTEVVFNGGYILDVSCSVWNGPQTDNDVRFSAQKRIDIDGDTTVTFEAEDNTL